MNAGDKPTKIKVRGARVHNLKNISVDIPLNEIVGIAGRIRLRKKLSCAGRAVCRRIAPISGISFHLHTAAHDSGSSSADVDEVLYVPAALALHQRPAVPGIRSTFRNRNRAAQQPAADVLPPFQPPLSQRPLSEAQHQRGGDERRIGLPGRAASISMRRARRSLPSIPPERANAAAAREWCERLTGQRSFRMKAKPSTREPLRRGIL